MKIKSEVKRAIIEVTNMINNGLPVSQETICQEVCKRFNWPQAKADSVKRYIRALLSEGILHHPLNDNHRVFVVGSPVPVTIETRLTDFMGARA